MTDKQDEQPLTSRPAVTLTEAVAQVALSLSKDKHGAAALCADAIRLLTEGIKTNGRAEPETEVATALRDILRLPAGDYEGAMYAWEQLSDNADRGWKQAVVQQYDAERQKEPRDTRDWRDV